MIAVDPYPAPLSLLPGEYAAPSSFEIHDAEPMRPHWIGVAVDMRLGKPLVRRVTIEPIDELAATVPPAPHREGPASSVPSDTVRVPVRRIVREALEAEGGEQHFDGERWTIEFRTPSSRRRFRAAVSDAVGRRPRVPDDELDRVADSYRRHMHERAPVRAVARELYSHLTTDSDVPWRRVAAARKRGFLGRTTRGRKGERHFA